MTDPTRLPGVKGSWIPCSECPPNELAKYELTGNEQYWRPHHPADPRPFTLPSATPAPPQPAAGARKFAQLIPIPDGNTLWAIADDGTAWLAAPNGYDEDDNWRQLPSLPDRDVG